MFQRFLKSFFVLIVAGILLASQFAMGQGEGNRRGAPKPVTVPLTIRVKKPEVEIRVVDLILNRAVTRPTAGHVALLTRRIPQALK